VNEHGAALNVFWTRQSELGAALKSQVAPEQKRQVKAKHRQHARRDQTNMALDQVGRSGYSDGAYKNEPEGCGLCARPFGSNVDELLSPAARR